MVKHQRHQITSKMLLRAYELGLFPMAEDYESSEIHWIDPERRGVIPLSCFHISRSLKRTWRRAPFLISVDKSFGEVIEACAKRTQERQNTWLNPRIIELYTELHRVGKAHSVECWSDGKVVGGLYGVTIGAAFFGESMFSDVRDSSKLALVHLVERLRSGGFLLLDTQFLADHLRQFGAIEIDRDEYKRILRKAISEKANFYSLDAVGGNDSIVTGGVPVEALGE